jgi:hypothetical protein
VLGIYALARGGALLARCTAPIRSVHRNCAKVGWVRTSSRQTSRDSHRRYRDRQDHNKNPPNIRANKRPIIASPSFEFVNTTYHNERSIKRKRQRSAILWYLPDQKNFLFEARFAFASACQARNEAAVRASAFVRTTATRHGVLRARGGGALRSLEAARTVCESSQERSSDGAAVSCFCEDLPLLEALTIPEIIDNSWPVSVSSLACKKCRSIDT